MKIKHIVLAAATLLAANSHATEAILASDTYASRSRVGIPSASNFGKKPTMAVNANSTGFVKFDLSTLPDNILRTQIQKATLKLYVGSVKTPGFIGVTNHTTPANWDEATTIPAIPGAPIAIGSTVAIPKGSSKRYITFDVTEKVREWIQDPNSNNGLAIYAADAGLNVQLDTKENVATGQRSELIMAIGMPSVAVRATKSSVQNIATSTTTGVPVTDWQTQIDTEAAFEPLTGIFTAPLSGKYMVSASMRLVGTWNAYSGVDLVLIKQPASGPAINTNLSTTNPGPAYTGNLWLNGSTLVSLEAGETLNINISQDHAPKNTSPHPPANHLSIVRVAD